MVDKAKIIYMTKLAVYDKNDAEKDQNILKFFVNDYVYRQNISARLGVLFGYLMLVAVDYLYKIAAGELDIFMLDYMAEVYKVAINAVALLVCYTFISSAAATFRYYQAAKRQNKYTVTVNQLEKLAKARQSDKEDTREYNGSDIIYKRNNR